LDEEEDVVAAKGGGVDGEEVTCVGCLGAQELGPSLFGAFRCGVDVVVFEDLLHGRLGDLVAEADEFAVYPPVSPRRVLSGETHNQPAQLDRSWRSADALAGWVGPVSGDSSSVPAQQGLGRDDPALAQSAGECRGDRSEQGPVLVVRSGTADLAAKHDDLEVFRAARADSEAGKCSDETVEEARHNRSGWRHQPTREFLSPTG
jgi:hypothetical protein